MKYQPFININKVPTFHQHPCLRVWQSAESINKISTFNQNKRSITVTSTSFFKIVKVCQAYKSINSSSSVACCFNNVFIFGWWLKMLETFCWLLLDKGYMICWSKKYIDILVMKYLWSVYGMFIFAEKSLFFIYFSEMSPKDQEHQNFKKN